MRWLFVGEARALPGSCELPEALRAGLPVCFSRVAEIVLAARVVNHKLSEASASINSQLQAKRTWNLELRHRRFGTIPFLVSARLRNILYRDLREAHNRTTARWPAAPWMLARALDSA